MAWSLQRIDCAYDYLGGYQYLDVCGSVLRDAYAELGYIPGSINTEKIITSKNQDGFVVNFSSSTFSMMQEEPSDFGDVYLEEISQWLALFWGRVSPVSCEKCRLVLDFVLPARSEEEVFSKLGKINVPLFHDLSSAIGFPELMQNLTFMFRSGSTTIDCTFMGTGFITPVETRNSVSFFSTERQRQFERDRYNRKHKKAGNEYSWAVNMKISVTEDSPPSPTAENNWGADRLKRQFDIAWLTKNKSSEIIRL